MCCLGLETNVILVDFPSRNIGARVGMKLLLAMQVNASQCKSMPWLWKLVECFRLEIAFVMKGSGKSKKVKVVDF